MSPRDIVAADSAVVLGEVPRLEDLIEGTSTEEPFSLASFTSFAKARLFEEAVIFLVEVERLKTAEAAKFPSELQRLVSTYVRAGSELEVNLSCADRKKAVAAADAALAALAQDPELEPDRQVLDHARLSILRVVKRDGYYRYVSHVVVQKQLMFARTEAMWWKKVGKGLTLREFFTFPSPVNSAESRLHNMLVSVLVLVASCLAYYYSSPWAFVVINYGFLARAVCGPRLDPQAFLVLFLLRPLAVDRMGLLKNHFTSGVPKHFAQVCGLVFSTGCTASAFAGNWASLAVFGGMLLVASLLAGIFDICIACIMLMEAAKAGLLPRSICEDCSIRFVGEHGVSVRGSKNASGACSPSQGVPKQANKRNTIPGSRGAGKGADVGIPTPPADKEKTPIASPAPGTVNRGGDRVMTTQVRGQGHTCEDMVEVRLDGLGMGVGADAHV